MRKLLMFIGLMVLLCLVLALPASAQAPIPTPVATQQAPVIVEQPPVVIEQQPTFGGLTVTEVVLLAVLLVVIVGGGFFLNTVLVRYHELAEELKNALPQWAWESLHAGVDKGLGVLDTVVAATPNPLDDDLEARVKTIVEQIFSDIQNAKPAPVITAPAGSTVTQTTVTPAAETPAAPDVVVEPAVPPA